MPLLARMAAFTGSSREPDLAAAYITIGMVAMRKRAVCLLQAKSDCAPVQYAGHGAFTRLRSSPRESVRQFKTVRGRHDM
jgi:hypothetical protein